MVRCKRKLYRLITMQQCRLLAMPLSLMLTLHLCLISMLANTDLDGALYKLWYVKGYKNSSESVEITCYYDTTSNTLAELEASITPDTSIFFLETSCKNSIGIHLNPRQACAVESAAKMNPESTVYVLFPSPVVDVSSAHSTSVQQLLKYPNIRMRHINMERYFKNTPLEQWFLSGQLLTSRWPRSHTSDILRYLTLWKYGGIYLDLDVVITEHLADLKNFAGAESSKDVAVGIMSFSKGGVGHQMATTCVNELSQDYRGYRWAYNGPGVITRMLQQWCGTNNLEEMTPEICDGFTVFPPSTFYPLPWLKWRMYFDSENGNSTLRLLADSKAIHVWNKMSSNATVSSDQPYAVIARKYCPNVHFYLVSSV